MKLVGPVFRLDGYGSMMREFCLGLIENNVDFTVTRVDFSDDIITKSRNEERLGNEFNIINKYVNKPTDYDTVIQFLTADNFPIHYEKGKRNIGYTMWETDKIPGHWVDICNTMDKIIVPSSFNYKVFKESGVTKNIEVIPIPFDPNKFINASKNKDLINFLGEGKLNFYSIFQWGERKNPKDLLKAYYSSFSQDDDVNLVLKTYKNDFSKYDRKLIEQEVYNIKHNVKRVDGDYPKVTLITNSVSVEGIISIHKTCDVFVSSTRGEGWNMGLMDSLLAGNHAIATNFSAQTDFLDTYHFSKNQIYDLVNYQLDFASGASPLYSSDQKWACINVKELSDKMIKCYNDFKENGEVPGQNVRNDYVEYLKTYYDRKEISMRLLKV